jgi:hypothetical protein
LNVSEIMEKSSDSIRAVAGEEEDDPAAQPNIALMFELKEREIARRSRHIKTAGLLFSCILVLGVGGYAWMRYWSEPVTVTNGPRETLPTIIAKEIREQGEGDYTQKIISVIGLRETELLVNRYDFDANRFLRGKEVVDDPDELRRVLIEKSAELKNSLIIIFAGASFDGEPGDNRNLCRRRGCYVGKLAAAIPGVGADRLWMIAAGEHHPPNSGSGDENTEENIGASPNGAQVLRGQRKLLLITIPKTAAGPSLENASEVVRTVVEALRRGKFVPTEYDHGQSEPTPFANMRCELPTL